KQDKSMVDETITPMILNGLIERILQEAIAKNKEIEGTTVRLGFEGEHMKAEVTWKAHDKQSGQVHYFNFSTLFDAEVQEGKITKLELHNFSAGGREAPFLVRMVISFMVTGFKELVNNGANNPNNDPKLRQQVKSFEALKLLKREGDRLHIVVDPSKFQEVKKAAESDDEEDEKDAKKDKAKDKEEDK